MARSGKLTKKLVDNLSGGRYGDGNGLYLVVDPSGARRWIVRVALVSVLTESPLVSAPMAKALTHASRAAVQRNLALMEAHGLIREVTGQGRFRIWQSAV